jgi:hypothetical protein
VSNLDRFVWDPDDLDVQPTKPKVSRAEEARRYRQRTRSAPTPISRAAVRRAGDKASLAAAKRGDAKVPTRRKRRG